MTRRTRALVAALLSIGSSAASASTALRPAVTTQGSYGESFTVVADLDDGSYVHLSLGFTNLGPGSVKAICRAVVVPPAGAMWSASTRVGRDGWSWAGSDRERLSIASCAAEVDAESTRVDVPLSGGRVQLRLGAPAVRRIPADAALAVGDQYYRTEILVYRARVEGTVQLPGGAARSVTGAGYLDHTRSTIRPKDLAERWVRFRALRGDRGMVLLARRGHDGRFTPVWACDPPGRCRHFDSFSTERSGEPRAPAFRISLPSERGAIRIESGRLLYRDDPIDELGLLGKIAAPFFGNPVTYTYRGRLDDGQGPPLDGILEVELSGE